MSDSDDRDADVHASSPRFEVAVYDIFVEQLGDRMPDSAADREAVQRELRARYPGLDRFTTAQLAAPIDPKDPALRYARQARRNEAFVESWKQLRLVPGATAASRAFHAAWSAFAQGGIYRSWSETGPTADGSELNKALYALMVHNGRKLLTERQVRKLMHRLLIE